MNTVQEGDPEKEAMCRHYNPIHIKQDKKVKCIRTCTCVNQGWLITHVHRCFDYISPLYTCACTVYM